jgi:hypothetical protein
MTKLSQEPIDKDDIASKLETISFRNNQILTITRLATKANFRLEAEEITTDMVRYISEYAREVSSVFSNKNKITIKVLEDGNEFFKKFKPIEISIVVDNLVSNANRARV